MGVLLALAIRSEAVWSLLVRNRRLVKVIFAGLVLVFCVLTITNIGNYGLSLGLTAIVGMYVALLALLLLESESIFAAVFRWRVLRYFGRVSYCLYIVHQGINGILWPALWTRIGLPHAARGLLISAITLAVCLLIAELSWRVLESPLIRRAHKRFVYST
jgi:peptidoglycan/LPS O-acetylase OafA/YrhL